MLYFTDQWRAMMAGKARGTDSEFFENRYIPEPNSGCWLWIGALAHSGYGRMRGREYAHRFSYRFHKGQVGNLHVLHRCDNPPCVNPDHLFLGTHDDNMADMVSKGRYDAGRVKMRGELHYKAVLTEKQVYAIRRDERRVGEIAKEYGVTPTAISAVKSRMSWRHLPEGEGD
jgi:hypothetical protein